MIAGVQRTFGQAFDRVRQQLGMGLSVEPRLEPLPVARPEPPAAPEGIAITRGRNIYLRTMTPSDLQFVSDWADDPYVDWMVGSELLHAYKDVYERDASFYEAILVDSAQVVFIVMANSGFSRPVGLVRLFNIHQTEGYAGIETVIGDRRASRLGYGVQASRLMAYYGVDVLALRRLEAKAYEYNPLSINTLRRNGFTHEGTLRQAAYRDGRYWDILVFGILKDEIEVQRARDRYLLPSEAAGM